MNLNEAIALVSAPTTAEFSSKEIFYHNLIVSGTVTKISEGNLRFSLTLPEDLEEVLETLGFDIGDLSDLTLDQVQRFINRLAKFIQSHDLTPFGYVSLTKDLEESSDEEESEEESSEESEESSDY